MATFAKELGRRWLVAAEENVGAARNWIDLHLTDKLYLLVISLFSFLVLYFHNSIENMKTYDLEVQRRLSIAEAYIETQKKQYDSINMKLDTLLMNQARGVKNGLDKS